MKLRVWWIPQVPGKIFYVEVTSVVEGVKLMDTLAAYDKFQFDNKIKPDYANAGGLEMFTEDEGWVSWYDEESGEDDEREFVRHIMDVNKDELLNRTYAVLADIHNNWLNRGSAENQELLCKLRDVTHN